jgi:hypothetical protein
MFLRVLLASPDTKKLNENSLNLLVQKSLKFNTKINPNYRISKNSNKKFNKSDKTIEFQNISIQFIPNIYRKQIQFPFPKKI